MMVIVVPSDTTMPAGGQKTHHPLFGVGQVRHSAPAEVFLSFPLCPPLLLL